MPSQNNKITVRQVIIIFIICTLSPAIRLFPNLCSELGGIAGWVTPALSAPVLVLIFYVFHYFFVNNKYANLSDVFNACLGKAVGKILLGLYLIWFVILLFLYIRYYANRLLGSIFAYSDNRFLILTMMMLVFIPVRGKIETFARFVEFSFLMFTVVFIIFFIFLIPSVKPENLLPITHHDAIPAIKATYPILGIWGYITFGFFLGDNIIDKDKIKKHAGQCVVFISVLTLVMMVFVLGSLGWQVAQRMPLPFFNAVRMIELIESFDRFESILLSIWVVADFIIIIFFAKLVMNVVNKLFDASEPKYFASPVILMGYIGSRYIAQNRFEMETFSTKIALPINILLSIVLPIVVFVIGKLRKKF